jgi:hypothetical protein
LAGELAIVDLAHDALNDWHGVPRTEENADFSFRRQHSPESHKRRTLALLVRWFKEAAGLNVMGVHPFIEQVDRFALPAPSAPAIKINTGKRPLCVRSYWASSNASRSFGSSRRYAAFST